jgi:oligopeptidase A
MSMRTVTIDANPLLDFDELPPFDRIRAEHVEPAMRALLAALTAELEQAEANATPTWDGVVAPIEELTDRLGRVWGAVGHLMGVQNGDAIRAAYERMQPEVVTLSLRLGQSAPFYRALRALRENADREGTSSWVKFTITNFPPAKLNIR